MKRFAIVILLLLLAVGLPGQGIVDHATTKPPPGAEVDWGNPINRDLRFWWPLNERAGVRVTDITGNASGTLENADPATSWRGSRLGGTLHFVGASSNERVALGTPDVAGINQISITAWFKADSFPGGANDPRIISKASGPNEADHYWMLGTTLSGGSVRPRFRLKTDSTTTTLTATSSVLLTDVWHFLAATYDGANMRIYLDGVDVASTAKTGNVALDSTISAYIGNNPGGSTKPWDGLIDDVKVYDRPLSLRELDELRLNPDGGILRIVERLTRWFSESAAPSGNPSLINFPLTF